MKRRGRPATFQQRVLVVLLQHHRAAGWEAPLPRGELLAQLCGWRYGRQVTSRVLADGEVPVAFTGVSCPPGEERAYDTVQKHLSRALRGLYRSGLVRVADRRGRFESAPDFVRELEAAMQEPAAAYRKYLATGLVGTYEEFLAGRRTTLAAWKAGRGRPDGRAQLLMLTPVGRNAAEQAGNIGEFLQPPGTHQNCQEA